jgi:hypothetical protein
MADRCVSETSAAGCRFSTRWASKVLNDVQQQSHMDVVDTILMTRHVKVSSFEVDPYQQSRQQGVDYRPAVETDVPDPTPFTAVPARTVAASTDSSKPIWDSTRAPAPVNNEADPADPAALRRTSANASAMRPHSPLETGRDGTASGKAMPIVSGAGVSDATFDQKWQILDALEPAGTDAAGTASALGPAIPASAESQSAGGIQRVEEDAGRLEQPATLPPTYNPAWREQ